MQYSNRIFFSILIIFTDYNSKRKFLKKTAVPSCNLPKGFGAKKNIISNTRLERRLKREDMKKLNKKKKYFS